MTNLFFICAQILVERFISENSIKESSGKENFSLEYHFSIMCALVTHMLIKKKKKINVSQILS